MDEKVLREILRSGMSRINESLKCPIHGVAEQVVGTLLRETDFTFLQFSGLPDPVCIMDLHAWTAVFLRCPKETCEHFNKQRCPRCGNWSLRFHKDEALYTWRCEACPLTAEFIEGPTDDTMF